MTPRFPIEKGKKSRVVATATFTEQEYAAAEADALKHLGEHVEVKGFRAGHAPADMVRQRVGEDRVFEEAIRALLRTTLQQIVEEHGLKPVMAPKVEAVSRMPVTLKITFVERPEVTVKGAHKIKIDKKDAPVDPKDVQRVLDSVLQEHRLVEPVDRAAKEGDQVTVDFHATDADGKQVSGLSAQRYAVVIGKSNLLPGFEPQLVGMSKGEQKEFSLTLPDKFQLEELKGKPVRFHITMHTVEAVTLPALDDAFAKEKLHQESAKAFTDMVEKSIKEQEEQFDRMRREKLLLDDIRDRTTADIAEELIEDEMRHLVSEWSEHLAAQKVDLEEALKREGKTAKQMEEEFKKRAEERWKLRLGIGALIEERKTEVSDDDMAQTFDAFLLDLPEERQDAARKEWEKKGELYQELRYRALTEKVIKDLLDQ